MTLTKAISELFQELQRSDLTEEEKKALDKYKMWLLGIKTTVTNNKESKSMKTEEEVREYLKYYWGWWNENRTRS